MSIDSTSFFCYVYSSWLTKYLWKAYRKGITLSDIPEISPLDTCSYNVHKFENLWNEELRVRGPTSASLPLVAWRFVRFRVITSFILNALSQIIKFVFQTILLRNLLEYSESPERNFFNGMHWVIYIVAFDLLQTILYTWSEIMNQRTALRLKAVCMSLLFKKVVNLNNASSKTTDELMDMLSKDGNKVYEAVYFGTPIVNAPVVTLCVLICISIWLSPVALIGLAIFLFFYVMQYWLIHLINYCKENASDLTSIRVQKTIDALSSIRLIKINGWEQHFIQNILNLRSRESKWLWKLSYVKSLNSSMVHAIPIISVIVMFFMHFTDSSKITTSIAFPICVVIIVQMHEAYTSLKTSLSHLRDSLSTFKRIKSGLLLDDLNCHIMKPYEPTQAVAVINASFAYDIFRNRNYGFENLDADKKTYMNENNVTESEKQKLNNTLPSESKRIEILTNIIFKAKKGQLIGITGATKSGKSSLLLAALGQIRMTCGQLMRQGSCAYVGQKAWIVNATIRENILFEEVFDAKRYYEAQVVSKLREEVKSLPNGDETEIGEGGLTISEDLKQRIALARAFYANRDIYFLDDPLSFMDDNVKQEIFEDFIVRALAEKTILLATYDIKHLDRCDYIYFMRDGTISERGRHKELMRLGKEYASMIKSIIADADGDYADDFYNTDSETPKEKENSKTKERRRSMIVGNNTMSHKRERKRSFTINNVPNNRRDRRISLPTDISIIYWQERKRSAPSINVPIDLEEEEGQVISDTKKINAEPKETNLTSITEKNNDSSDKKNIAPFEIKGLTYYTYAKSLGGLFLLLPIILVYVIYSGIGVHSLLRLAWWIDAANTDNRSDFYKNWYGFCFFLIILGCIVQSFVVQLATTKIADNLHNALLDKLMHAPMRFHDTTPFGKIRTVLSHDVEKVSLALPSKLDSTLRYMVLGFFTFYVLISTIPWFTNYIVFTSILFFFVARIYRAAEVNLRRIESELKLPTNNFLRNSIEGLNVIRTFKKEQDFLSKFQDLVDENSAFCFVKEVSKKWLLIRLQLLTTTCVFVAGSLIIIMKGTMSSAIAGLTFVYLLQVPNIILMAINYFSKAESYFCNVQNICNYIQTLTSENGDKISTVVPNSDWPTAGFIEFDNVQLRCNDDVQLALDHISFTINSTEKAGVLAKLDSDKNALITAIYRLYELYGGQISIDCVDISKINVQFLRNQLCIIPQNPIFYGTIRFFLDHKKCHTDAEIWNALERMYLKDKISSLASQLHYSIDAKIFNIREKQQLFLARAFLCNCKILVIEESSASDSETASFIHQVIDKEFPNCTVLMIARRSRLLLSCDRVLVLENGRILEFDSPSALLADRTSGLRKLLKEEEMNDRRI